MKRIGILGAMPVEINDVVSWLKDITQIVYGMRTCYLGIIKDVEAVFFFFFFGKVMLATIVTHLIFEFGITEFLVTGVAGAISSSLNIGYIVVASSLVQHDMMLVL